MVDALLGPDVHGAGGIVQDQDRRVGQHRAGDGDPLALSARQRVAAFADHLVEAVFEVSDEPVGLGHARCCQHLVAWGLGPSEGDVVVERAGEQERLVRHLADVGAEAGEGEVAYVVAVDEDRSAVDVVEAWEESGHGGLAASGPAHDGNRLAGLDDQVEAIQDCGRLPVRGPGVPERDVPELDPSPGGGEGSGPGPVDYRRLLVQDLVDAQGRGCRPLGLEQHEAEHPERHRDHRHVRAECQQRADADLPVDHEVPAIEEDEGHP